MLKVYQALNVIIPGNAGLQRQLLLFSAPMGIIKILTG
jgi:hypothetical protein